MRCVALLLLLLAWGSLLPAGAQSLPVSVKPPAVRREFRGVWVATVGNIDWPSRPGLTTAEQQAELVALLDKAAQLHLNAVVFQVRPACDALYASPLEPWSEYLTGTQGQAPQPFYDPLAFAVAEAHRRGLELHAWFNPYRARYSGARSPLAPNHVARTHPELVRTYGKYLWLDPGEPAVQDYTVAVVRDVVRRYDIDGVHLDDYFYPYPVQGANGKTVEFPDEPSWRRYRASGGRLGRDDWRRRNVSTLIHRLYTTVKAEKPWVKFGVSPFGIWRPGMPPQIKGLDPYAELYADAHQWLANGWVDYLAPQLYWPIEAPGQSFPVLLDWWASQNFWHRHLWPGLDTGRVGAKSDPWPADEIEYQIKTTRGIAGATGDIHFSISALMDNRGGIADRLARVYAVPALVPAFPWLDSTLPRTPALSVTPAPGGPTLRWSPGGRKPVWLWAVQTQVGDDWQTQILPAAQTSLGVPADADAVAVTAVDRVGNQSLAATWAKPSP